MCNTGSNYFQASKKQHALMNHELRNMIQFASIKMCIGQYHDQPKTKLIVCSFKE